MWKKRISHKVRERIAYSGIEDSDGWVIIDQVEVINEPDDRIWRVLSTCGNLAKFLLVLRRKSYSKYTFVVVPSCIASVMLGRYVPGVVLLHIASMSLLTWPYLTFFPFLFFNVGKFGSKKAARYLYVKIPKCYRGFKRMINSANKKSSPQNPCITDGPPKKEPLEGEKGYFFLPSAWFQAQITKCVPAYTNPPLDDPPPSYDESVKPTAPSSEDRPMMNTSQDSDDDADVLDYEEFRDYIPFYDEKTAFLLEEAAEGISSSESESEQHPDPTTAGPSSKSLSAKGMEEPNVNDPDESGPFLLRTVSMESIRSSGSSTSSYIRDMLEGASMTEHGHVLRGQANHSGEASDPVELARVREMSLADITLKKKTQRHRDKDSPFSDMLAEGLKNVYQSLAENFATWATDAQAVAAAHPTAHYVKHGSGDKTPYEPTEIEDVEFYIEEPPSHVDGVVSST